MVTLDVAARQPGEGFLERLDRSRRAAQERIAARHAELRAAGISCMACEDTGWIGGRSFCPQCDIGRDLERAAERQQAEQVIDLIPAAIGIPRRYQDYTLDTFPDQQSPTLARVRAWLADERDPRKPGLLLYGGFGRGKTGLLASMLRDITYRHVVKVDESGEPYMRFGWGYTDVRYANYAQFTTSTGLLESLRPKPDRDDGDETFSRYLDCQYLAIDDLGAERLTAWGADRLYEIVNERYNRMLPLIVSSNLSPDGLAGRINGQLGDRSGDRILERLADSCTFIAISDSEPNWRLTPITA